MEIFRTHEYGITLVRGGQMTPSNKRNVIFMYAKYFHGDMAFQTKVVFLGLPVYNSVET